MRMLKLELRKRWGKNEGIPTYLQKIGKNNEEEGKHREKKKKSEKQLVPFLRAYHFREGGGR